MSDGFLSVPEKVELPITLVERSKVKYCKANKLKSGFYYAFQIISYNACGETVNPIQWFQTQASVPIAPEAPTASSITCDSISLEWHDLTPEECNGSALQNYFLQVCFFLLIHISSMRVIKVGVLFIVIASQCKLLKSELLIGLP